VKAGETLYQISRDYRIPLANILQANPSIVPNMIYPGQALNIPGLPDPNSIPYRIEVSVQNRWLRLYRNNTLLKEYPIAVGRMLHGTPKGNL
jgi:L,D-transpeptidase ErfK/SrfK